MMVRFLGMNLGRCNRRTRRGNRWFDPIHLHLVFHFLRETGHEQCALLRCPPGSLDPRDYKHEGTHPSGIGGEMQQAVTLPPQAKKVRILPAVQQHIHKQEQWKEVNTMAWGDGRTKTAEWKRIRNIVLKRDECTCQRCGDTGNEVNHIIPVTEGGTDALENLETLCGPCRQTETVAQTTRAVRRHAAWGRHPGERHPGLA